MNLDDQIFHANGAKPWPYATEVFFGGSNCNPEMRVQALRPLLTLLLDKLLHMKLNLEK